METALSIDPVWIGSRQVAELTGYRPRKVIRLAEARKIPAYRPRGSWQWKFKTEEIRKWVKAGFNGATLS